jgi:hypothetical protein
MIEEFHTEFIFFLQENIWQLFFIYLFIIIFRKDI